MPKVEARLTWPMTEVWIIRLLAFTPVGIVPRVMPLLVSAPP